MLTHNQARWHRWLTTLTVAALVVLLLVGPTQLPPHRLPLLMAGIGAVMAAGHFWAALRNPNRNLVANRTRATKAIARGKLILDAPGGRAQPRQGGRAKLRQVVALAALTIGVLSAPVAEVVRIAGGWPLNPAASPPIAGPGDTIRLALPHTVASVGGRWRATAHARVVGAERRSFPVSSSQDTWGDTIRTSRDNMSSPSALWAEVTVPDEPSLAGQTVPLQLDLDITYPKGGIFFHNERERYSHTLALKLASPGSGSVYSRLWWGGMVGGGILLLGAGGVLARRKQAGVSSTQVQLIPTNMVTLR